MLGLSMTIFEVSCYEAAEESIPEQTTGDALPVVTPRIQHLNEGENVSESKYRKGAACGDGIDLNTIRNDRECEEKARKE